MKAEPLSLLTRSGDICAWLYHDHLIVCDLLTQHMGLYNPSAAVVWMLLESKASTADIASDYGRVFGISQEIARRDVTDCLNGWHSQGWLDSQNDQWQIRASSLSASEIEFAPLKVPPLQVLRARAYHFGDIPFELRVLSSGPFEQGSFEAHFFDRLLVICEGFGEITDPCHASYKHESKNRADTSVGQETTPSWVKVIFTGDGIALEDSSQLGARLLSSDCAMACVYESFIRVSYPERNVVMTLHAAGIRGSQSISLAGVSGVGKSTLSAYLGKTGWDLLGDDIVAVELAHEAPDSEASRLGLLPFPTSIGLKTGSWTVLQSMYPEIAGRTIIPYGDKEAKYVPLPIAPQNRRTSCWDAVVLPRYTPGALAKLTPLSGAAGFQGLLTAGLSLFGSPSIDAIDHALRALSELPCYSLEYHDLKEARACLDDLMPR